jgi:hypothetical protein
VLALALAALAVAAPPPADAPPSAPAERLRIRTVTGRVAEVSLAPGRLSIDGAEGPIALVLDRNTVVYLEARLGTIRDLAPGQPIRAAAGSQGQAYWVEVLRPEAVPPPRPAPEPAAPPPSPGSGA